MALVFDIIYARCGSHRRRIWKLVAFLGRYGNQPASISLRLPVDDLMLLVDETGLLLDKENAAAKPKE